MSSHMHSAFGRLEVVETGRRRRWSEDEKVRIVLESLAGPRLVSATARRHGVSRAQLLTWRRKMNVEQAVPTPPAPKKEKLEPQLIEGLMAEGTRTTVTIPAGEFDNEQPMEITHEQWYSPELRMVVLLRHNDPRFGETVFRLTNVSRTEPSPELFAEPQGYRAIDGREMMRGRPVMGRP